MPRTIRLCGPRSASTSCRVAALEERVQVEAVLVTVVETGGGGGLGAVVGGVAGVQVERGADPGGAAGGAQRADGEAVGELQVVGDQVGGVRVLPTGGVVAR